MNKIQAWLQGWAVTKGSDTSGNYAHRGVKNPPWGKGGSAPGGGHTAIGVTAQDNQERVRSRISEHKAWQEWEKKPPQNGDYVRHKTYGELGGKVIGREGNNYQVMIRNGDIYTLPKGQVRKIRRDDAIRFNLESDKAKEPPPPPKGTPDKVKMAAQTLEQLEKEFGFKLKNFKVELNWTKGVEKIKKLKALIEALQAEYRRLSDFFTGA